MEKENSTLNAMLEINQDKFCSRGGILETSALGPFAAGIFYKCNRQCSDCTGHLKKTNYLDMTKGGNYSSFSPVK